ncbi:hypothetical protein ANN_22419 [Periplaneta americana]|uniref:Reverse transcriptase n=1 Tax=Periplaneta americana TaxID=6978 RepID=A0ABQ8S837_PERAM|nr:hypothetical protein ANN_22419 [Periplaneta americana]
MSPGSNTVSYPAFAHIGLRENPGKNLNQPTEIHIPFLLRQLPPKPPVLPRLGPPRMLVAEAIQRRIYLLSGYVPPIRAVPGRSRDVTRCRRCLSEIETLPHILGFCPYIEALCNIRHHAVRSMLAEALKEIEFTVHQEVKGLATQGSVRRIDIIAIKNNSTYILDPTIRFEIHEDQMHEVNSEKKQIYEPTIPFFKDKYCLSHIDVIGLMVGARGTITSFFANKCKNLGLPHSIVKEIAISALKGSVQILK